MNGQIKFTIAMATMICLMLSAQAVAQPCGGYEVTAIIQTPVDCGFGFDTTTAVGLNDDGDVVGYYWCSGWEHKEAFVWTAKEGFVTLERPEGIESAKAEDINDEGLICGTAAVSGVGSRGFVYGYEGGQFTILDIPPGGNWSEAHGINALGQITGFWGNNVTGFWKAFIWEKGEMIDIGPSIGEADSRGLGINDTGAITGWWHRKDNGDRIAFVWEDGEVTSLGPIPEGFTSSGQAINDLGYVAGDGKIFLADGETIVVQSFLWADNQMTNLGTLPGTTFARARGINDQTRIVGYCHNQFLTDQAPFIWQDSVMTNINDLLPSDSELTVFRAVAINSTGQITGSAANQDNVSVAFILTPIESPTGDLDDDCQVGVFDLLILLSVWGSCENCAWCPADLDKNCTVSTTDLLILLSNWG